MECWERWSQTKPDFMYKGTATGALLCRSTSFLKVHDRLISYRPDFLRLYPQDGN